MKKHYWTVAKNTANAFADATYELYLRWFHTRNIIVVSEHKVKHIPIGGFLQFCVHPAVLSAASPGAPSPPAAISPPGRR